MKIGIMGAGNIANSMATTVNGMGEEAELYCIASRSYEKAKAFAERYGIEKAYGSYEEMLNDPKVELIYVATPHSHHFENAKLCMEHGKNVLVEKAFTTDADKAKKLKSISKENNVYLAEALWPRYMPSRGIIDKILSEKPLGEISMATCNLSYNIDEVERIIKPELAGGALLDIGVYGVNFLLMHLGKDIEKIDVSAMMMPSGVDGNESICIHYKNGKMGVTNHSVYARSDRKGIFYCENGYIIVENINNPNEINLFDYSDNLVAHYDVPPQITGYEYEVAEAIKCINEGKTESDSMPLDESIFLMETLDKIKAKF